MAAPEGSGPSEGRGGEAVLPHGWGSPGTGRSPGGAREEIPPAPRQYYVPAGAPTAPSGAAGIAHQLPPPPAPGVAPAPPSPPRRRRWRLLVGVLGALALLAVGFALFGLWQFHRMERVAVASVLSPASGSGTNYLIVGSDTREGFDPSDPTAGAVLGDGTADDPTERSDTMLVLRLRSDGAEMLSIPRDLWVSRPDGGAGRINATFNSGPAALIATIRHSLGIPIHHYVEVDFVTFAGLVDAVGGVTIEIPHPARDPRSGLDLPTAGQVRLDGSQALAYVRSRAYTELIEGRWRTDPTGDLGRTQRQQLFLRAVMAEIGSTVNPIEIARLSWAVADGLRIDDRMGFLDALRLARRLRGLEPETVELPVYGFRTSGGASVLGLRQPEAEQVLERFSS